MAGDGSTARDLERVAVGKDFKVPVISRDPLVDERASQEPVWVSFRARKHRKADEESAIPEEEYVAAGPTSSRVVVVDYDASQDQIYKPVRPLQDGTGFALGGAPELDDFRFHQVNVWAIVNRTLAQLEHSRMLGRPIPWASGQGRLLVLPHAGYGENAYYSRATGALHLMYFAGRDGRQVFTCLSHDIVTHELGHAVLDGLKPHYNEVSSIEAAGFHEYFGDALALTSSLTFREVLERAVGGAPETLDREVMGQIAVEFGESRGGGPLRDAAERVTMDELRENFSEHDHSRLLTNVFFEVLCWLYPIKLKDARSRGKKGGQAAVAALVNAATQTSRLMLRAIDYCPPVDITYLDYARAILRADAVAYPGVDTDDVRGKVIELLLARGIGKTKEDLTGDPTLEEVRNRTLAPYDIERLAATPETAYRFLDSRREKLSIPIEANLQLHRLYRTRKTSATGYYCPREVVLEFVWSDEVKLEGPQFGTLDGTRMPMRCGGTLVFDQNGNVLHYALKRRTPEREAAMLAYVKHLVGRRRIGLAERGFGATAGGRPVAATVDGGRVSLSRDPALRHEDGRRRCTHG